MIRAFALEEVHCPKCGATLEFPTVDKYRIDGGNMEEALRLFADVVVPH